MAAELLSFFRPAPSVRGDWSTQEIAEFYRVEAALVQAGVSVFVDRGVSDEGDPWFVFCRAMDGEVIVHFARISGNYLIVADSVGQPLRGSDFRKLLSDFASLNPTLIPLPAGRGSKLLLHPASLLAAVVATALFHMSGSEAVAHTLDASRIDASAGHRHSLSAIEGDLGGNADADRKWIDRQIAAAVVAMVALAATDATQFGHDALTKLASSIVDLTNDHLVSAHSVVADAAPVHDDGHVQAISLLSMPDAHVLSADDGTVAPDSAAAQPHSDQANAAPQSSASQASPDGHPASDHGNGFEEHGLATADASGSGSDTAAAQGTSNTATGPNAADLALDNKTADLSSHVSPPVGSSSPDHSAPVSPEAPTATVFVNNELQFANHVVSQVNLTDSLSVPDVIAYAANDVFGSNIPLTLSGANEAAHDLSAGSSSASNANFLLPQPFTSDAHAAAPVVAVASEAVSHPAYAAFGAAASAMIDAFVRANNFEIVTSNNNVVLFDTNAADFSSPDLVAKTWSMNDGSTISIVGVLPHNLVTQV